MIAFLAIVVLAELAAITYGVLHDQVTIRICLEYFTEAHPKVLDDPSPTLLAATWGVLATWWVGLPLGILLAMAARWGPGPTRDAASLVRPLARLLLFMGSAAVLAAVIGYLAHILAWHPLEGYWAEQLTAERHARFQSAWWAHLASYGFAAFGGLWLVGRVALQRRGAARR